MELNNQTNDDGKSLFENRLNVEELNHAAFKIRNEIGKVIVGQERVLDYLLTALLANGHVLLEGVPGIAKTMIAKLLSKCVDTGFSRIQFTPDLMPSDVLGTMVFHSARSDFEFNKGPVFSNFVLIDEVNRAPAKTQAALFEVMEERQVTIDGQTHPMERPFIVLATQNPVEHEGTYRLPEAQLDRFLFKIKIDYPSVDQEVTILQNTQERGVAMEMDQVSPVISAEEIVDFQQLVTQVKVEHDILSYIANIVEKTRNNSSLFLGASPRASIAILKSAKAFAALEGRDFVTPEDVKEMVVPVLNHRVILTPEKEMEGLKPENVIKRIVDSVDVPR
ncbi:MoxR family ATPase [Marinilabilia salmonicolor]|jgi:MoxR-like ATPase|uniref:MoxR-like ATPase n=1 Tax=Marinilabilia salmonicolor TaxID=989 RepID=A0A2T0XT02_9BACT|nr:MoxR family ATPase [Marinilabilia salmonicolor]PRZ01992.1 MoxR-like ATPase [Marinilabilia salmonicolor]RCW39426.1 MoxR-like ATPase [Marinilabilia salmonicolor]